jgi:NADH:ubiquinone oxidoreductase subunit E
MHTKEPWTAYEPKRENILSMLHETQRRHADTTHIPTDDLARLSEYVGVPLAEMEGIAGFYQAFSRKPRARHVIRLCDSLSCRVRGSVDIYRHIRAKLGAGSGESSADGRYYLEIVNCLGSCDTAPNVMIDDLLLTNVTPQTFDRAIDALNDIDANDLDAEGEPR